MVNGNKGMIIGKKASILFAVIAVLLFSVLLSNWTRAAVSPSAPHPLSAAYLATLKTWSVSAKGADILRANTEVTLVNHKGSGCLTMMWFAMEERTRIRVYVDGETKPSIDMASDLGAGYGFGGSPAPTGSRVMGRYGGQFYNYHIPYQTSIRVTLLPITKVFNAGIGTRVYYTIRGTDNLPLIVGGLTLPKNTRLYLYRNEPITAKPLQEFNLCNVKGAGMLYLVVMTAHGLAKTGIMFTDLAYMEGCVRAYIDGSPTPELLSSGMEDYFLGSGYFNQNQTYYGTVAGLTYLNKADAEFSAYRFHDTDPVFFSRGFRLTLRNGDTYPGGQPVFNPQATRFRTYTWLYQW